MKTSKIILKISVYIFCCSISGLANAKSATTFAREECSIADLLSKHCEIVFKKMHFIFLQDKIEVRKIPTEVMETYTIDARESCESVSWIKFIEKLYLARVCRDSSVSAEGQVEIRLWVDSINKKNSTRVIDQRIKLYKLDENGSPVFSEQKKWDVQVKNDRLVWLINGKEILPQVP